MNPARVIELEIEEVVLHGIGGFDAADRQRLRRALTEALEARLAAAIESPVHAASRPRATAPSVTLPESATPRSVEALGDELAAAIVDVIAEEGGAR